MRMLSLCFLLLFISCERQENITLNKPASTAAHLLPPDLNPAEAYVKLCSKAGFKVSQELIDIFNNFDSTISSKRHYDHINFLDGITIGMGHWPQAEVNHFFGSLIKDSSAKANFLNEAVAAFKTLSKKECQKYLKGKSCNEAHIKSLISDTLFNIKFLKQKYGRNCRLNSQYKCASGASLYYELPWIQVVIPRALRNKAVVKWQLEFFKEDILEPARKKALESGLQNKTESLLIFSSFESSFKAYANKLKKVGKSNGFLEFGGKKYYWSKPSGLKNPNKEQLQSWRMLLAFRWYQYIKGKRAKRPKDKGCNYPVRDRQRHLYCKFMKKSWDKYWPDASIASHTCGKITERFKKIGGCGKIMKNELKSNCWF